MTFRKIDYLAWAREYMGRCRHDLAMSNVKPLTREELGVTLDQVDFASPEADGSTELRTLLSKRYGTGPERIFLTNGASMGMYLACAAAFGRGDEVILESPNYEPLYRVPLQLGAEVKMLDRRFDAGWQIDLEELERRMSRSTRAIMLTNLHNPSGVATNPEKIMTIGQIARGSGARVLVNEVYFDSALVPGLKPAASFGDHMVSIGSLSKVYGLGSLRMGWIAAGEEILSRVRTIADYLSGRPPGPVQSLALAALKKSETITARCRDIVLRNMKVVSDWLKKRSDLKWVEPAGATVCMIKLPPHVDALELSTVLREKHSTLVVPGDFFWVRGFIRVSLGADEDALKTGLKHLGHVIDQLKSGKR